MKRKVSPVIVSLTIAAAMLAGCGVGTAEVIPVEKITSEPVQVEAEAEAPVEEPATVVEEVPVGVATAMAEAPEETQVEEVAAAPAETPMEAVAETPEETPVEAVAETPEEPSDLPEGMMYSYLTGEPVEESYGQLRPFAVMINNLAPAVPQSSIVNADLLYEAYVESSITRLMAVYQDPSPYDKIGPIRSSRHYYLDFSDDNDAIYTHFGWSFVAEDRINNEGRNTINGMFYDGSWGFYRTDDRVAPHNAYATGQGLIEIAESLGEPRNHAADYQPNLKFNREDTTPEGEDATVIELPYEVNYPWFEYNADDKLYYRFEYGEPHVDMETGQQLAFKNVLVQFVAQDFYLDDPILQDLAVVGTGDGYYFSDGKVIPITWEKTDYGQATKYYTLDGQQLMMNPGKTMFQIAPPAMNVTWSADATASEGYGDQGEAYVEDTPFDAPEESAAE
ncbi:MAG: DUF3048 domain-containing protein [Eubacterium sp.]|nr:DUF3048 domain-containing protein [Eubacterium sp.]